MSKISEITIQSQSKKFVKDDMNILDIYIEQIKNCYILQECQVKNLCEKVILF
jgi:hypothetical protein